MGLIRFGGHLKGNRMSHDGHEGQADAAELTDYKSTTGPR